jgi:alcohol dehydrogenase class IV|tara:strand:+ start:11197 stop:12228 length:1032 start_codon:yes stop_codon:yes gene_type:complete
MARFKEQNVDIIIEKDAFSIFLKDLKDELNVKRVLVIASSGVDYDKVTNTLENARFEHVTVWQDSFTDPDELGVTKGITKYISTKADTIIGIGGGSVIDLCKAIVYDQLEARPNLILVPTTYAGTELTKGFMIVRPDHTKKSVYDVGVQPDVIIIDPTLALTLPQKVSEVVALDAMTHCLEGAVSSIKNPIAEGSALLGLNLCLKHLPVHNTIDYTWREDMAIAGLLGSKAMDCGLGHIHTITYAIANNTDLSHGELNCLFAPYVIYETMIKDNSVYRHVDVEAVMSVYRHYILEWELMSRYIDQHQEQFIEQAILDSAYISHPVPFTAQDFRNIFNDILGDD